MIEVPHPLPWYVAGPLIGLMVPALLLMGNKAFGVSSNLRNICAAFGSSRLEYFRYDWKGFGSWNLAFLLGIFIGALSASSVAPTLSIALGPDTVEALHQLGLRDLSGLGPNEVFSWASLLTFKGIALIIGGGFLVGFGTAWAGGCTSGHAIAGLASRQLPSLLAVCGFFGGGLTATHLLLPWLLR